MSRFMASLCRDLIIDAMTGSELLAGGAWREARRAFEATLAERESAEALEGLGLAAWWLDDGETVFESRERAYKLYLDADDKRSAARIAVWLAWDCLAFRGESAVANGWLQRARRLLEGLPESFLAEQVTMPPQMQPPTKSRFEMLLGAKEHEMHHRAQLMTLQRMIGQVPHLTRQMQERFAAMAAAAPAQK